MEMKNKHAWYIYKMHSHLKCARIEYIFCSCYTVYTLFKVCLIMCLTKLIKVFMSGDCVKHLER